MNVAQVGQRRARDALGIDAIVLVEILVLRSNERVLHALGDRGHRYENSLFGRKLGQKLAVTGLNAGNNLGFVICELAVVGQALTVVLNHQINGDEPADGEKGQGRQPDQDQAHDKKDISPLIGGDTNTQRRKTGRALIRRPRGRAQIGTGRASAILGRA